MNSRINVISNQEIKKIVDRYQNLRSQKQVLVKRFIEGKRPYLIFQTPPNTVVADMRSSEESFYANIENVALSLDVPSDHLPVMEPWFGTGVYANIYGCQYFWREGESPAVRYMYQTLEEVKNISKPRWEKSEIAQLVLDTIRYFKSKTGDAIPIVWTDTQSASDTATLVLNATEVFAGCLIEPELIMNFMKGINEVVIEFSRVQAELIGNALVKPGHIMFSHANFNGMSISDDNLAVASPAVNMKFNLPLDEEIGRALGGVAIHSCGQWAHTMPLVKKIVPACVAIDCAIDKTCDPNPNEPEKVRDAFAGSDINVHVRLTGETDVMLETVKKLLHPKLKLVVRPNYVDIPTAERNYDVLNSLLSEYYGAK
ncbi:MAG: hypothetical protein COY53_02995 [Elusimicrobia bacterium CG_4_10_14_0_8_um_filter_37_32]|nr:MAG: hypothetical protein COY53_02995 [Elusimicrobia bacterium CG_4_10_14_0_8_um_filter_37_32]